MSMKDLQAYEVQKEEDLRGIKAKGIFRRKISGTAEHRMLHNMRNSCTI